MKLGSIIHAAVVLVLVKCASGHGVMTSPKPRNYGTVALDVCGKEPYESLTKDLTSPVEYAAAKIGNDHDDEACHLWTCRGAQLDDNLDNVQVYPPGTVVPVQVWIRIRHTGVANVSVVDLAANKPIALLYNWDVYTNESLRPSEYVKNETDFSITIPELGSQCSSPGQCAIQWWWQGYNKQTYQNCIDFVTGLSPSSDQAGAPEKADAGFMMQLGQKFLGSIVYAFTAIGVL